MWHVAELTMKQHSELAVAVERATVQWLPEPLMPAAAVAQLDRVLLFLKQNGAATRQAQHVAFMAFTFGALVVQAQPRWRWASVSDDARPNPALLSLDGHQAFLAVDVVTEHIMGQRPGGLSAVFQRLVNGPWPVTGTSPTVVW
jgi:hypothetical protein